MENPKWKILLFLSILLSIGEIVKLSSSFSPTFNYHTFRSSTNSGSTSRYVSQESTTISEHAPNNNSNHIFNKDNEKSRGSILIPGKHKWLGGAVDSEGRIYGIPSNAKDIICLVPSSLLSSSCSSKEEEMTHADTCSSRMDEGDDLELDLDSIGNYTVHMIPLPSRIADGPFKWLRGIICGDYLYGIPAWSQQGVLRVDIASYWKDQAVSNSVVFTERRQEDDTYVTTIPLPEGALDSISSSGSSSSSSPSRWLWHGAALNQNKTAIYAIPSNARHVLKIDLQTQTTSLLSIPTTITALEQTNKWYGGILGDDNAIYGVPYAASGVLRIDANHDTVKVIGDDLFGIKKYNWHGGVKSRKNGKIYCFPAHHSHVLCIDTRWNSIMNNRHDDAKPPLEEDRMLELLPIHRADYDKDEVTKYKWLGGSIGADGNVYGMPSDASSILRIDTDCNVATTFGRVGEEKNKYQGGTLARDGVIYAIPSNANDILCIDTNQVHVAAKNDKLNNEIEYLAEDAAFTIGDIYALTETKRKDKWQGGFLGKDGSVYCIPENFNRILKLIPQKRDSKISFL